MTTTTATNLGNDDNNKTKIQEMTTTKLTTDNKQKATSKTTCDARSQKLC